MPIGKNALKRVTNNGYSKVAVSAPDMEHSEIVDNVIEAPKAQPKKVASVKTEPKKNTAPKAKKPPVKKPEIKAVEADSHPDGFLHYGVGAELPIYLL